MDRRDFLKRCMVGAGALLGSGLAGCPGKTHDVAGGPLPVASAKPSGQRVAAQPAAAGSGGAAKVGKNRVLAAPPKGLWATVAKDQAPAELVKAAVAAYGGMEAIIHKGDVVVIKPNLAWARGPETGANTNPEGLRAVIQLAQQAGASEVLVLENPCVSPKASFAMSGAQDVCDSLKVKLTALESQSQFREETISKGQLVTSELLPADLLDCDVYINLPCLKHHAATNMTLCMKNQMGAIFDPQHYHRSGSEGSGGSNLDRSIADLASALVPTLNIVDATRALTTNGPQGPGTLKETKTVIVSHDMVTADMLGAQLLGYTEKDVAHVRMASEMGLGRMDIGSLKIG